MTDARSEHETDPAGHDLVEELLFDVLESEAPEAALERVCQEHPGQAALLRRMAARMLGDGVLGDDSVVQPGHGGSGDLPERLGSYRLLRRLGAGGMGVVFAARDEDLRRVVALKIVRPELLWFEGSRERFLREVEAVARLKHPNIVPLHQFGEQDGVPYYAMELVDGGSLDDRIRALQGQPVERLQGEDLFGVPAGERVAASRVHAAAASGADSWVEGCALLVRQVAAGLQHAHDQGVIHRDLKPSNILLDGHGRARVVDFGLARTVDAQQITQSSSQIGSHPYMPPEQVAGRLTAHGPAQDIYSLGVTLYEALTLVNPFLVGSAEETSRRILDAAPVPPRRLNRRISWELETVCRCAMAPEPRRRYASMAAFAADLDNVLARRPITARRAGALRVVGRWVQRHPMKVTIGAVAVLLFGVLPIVFGLWQRSVSERMTDLAQRAERRKVEAERRTALASVTGAASALSARDVRAMQAALEMCPPHLRGFAWRRLSVLGDRSKQSIDLGASVTRVAAVHGESGVRIAAMTAVGDLVLIDSSEAALREVSRVALHAGSPSVGLFVSGAGGELLSVARDGRIVRYLASGGEPESVLELGTGVEVAKLHPGGDLLVLGRQDGVAERLDLGVSPPSRRTLLELPGTRFPTPVFDVAFSADGNRLAVARPGGASVFDAPFEPGAGRELPARGATGEWTLLVEFTDAAGTELACSTQTGRLGLIDVDGGGEWVGGRLALNGLQIRQLLAVPDRGELVSVSRLGIRVRDCANDTEWLPSKAGPLLGHQGEVLCVARVPADGPRLRVVSGGTDGTLRTWLLGGLRGYLRPPALPVSCDILSESHGGVVALRDGRLARVSPRLETIHEPGRPSDARFVRCSAVRNDLCVCLDEDGRLHLQSLAAVRPEPLPAPAAFESLPNARDLARAATRPGLLALAADRPIILTFERGSSEPTVRTLDMPQPDSEVQLQAVALDAGGAKLLAATSDHRVLCFDVESGRCLGELGRHGKRVTALCVARDAAVGFSASHDGIIRSYDLETLREADAPIDLGGRLIRCLAVTSDGEELAFGTVRGFVELWNVTAGVRLLRLYAHERAVYDLTFDVADEHLLSTSWDGTVCVRSAR